LLGSKLTLAEIAHVAAANAVEVEAEDDVRAALRASARIVLGCHADDLADRGVERPRTGP
jgi:hypothetical protein